MKTLVLNLTDDQYRRFATIGALLKTKPEYVAIGAALGEIDSWPDSWSQAESELRNMVEAYAEKQASFMPNQLSRGKRPIEETAPERQLRIARKVAV